MVQALQTDLDRDGYVKRGDLDDLREEILTGIQTGQILVPVVTADQPVYAGGTNHCPDSDLSYSTMAATVIGTLPGTAGDTNLEAYRMYRQDKTGNVLAITAQTLKAVGHSLFAANEGANPNLPRWDRVNGWIEIGALGATQYDIAVQLLSKIVGPGQRWYVRVKLVALNAAIVPADVQLFAGIWHIKNDSSQGWVSGGAFNLTYQIIGAPGTRSLSYRVLAQTDSGVSLLSNILTIPNAPNVLSPTNYIKLFYAAGPGFIEFQAYRSEGGGAGLIAMTATNLVGGTYIGGVLTKTAATGWNNCGFSSVQSLVGDGYIEWTVRSGSLIDVLIGLSYSDPDQNYTSVRFAWNTSPSVGADIYENGTSVLTGTMAVPGVTVFRIQRVGTTITYYRDGVLKRTTSSTTAPLYLDVAIYTNGGACGPFTMMNLGVPATYSQIPPAIRNSTDFQLNDVGQVGIPVSGWPADPGNAPRAYAQSLNVRIAAFGTPWSSNDLSIDVPTTYDFSQTQNNGQFLRIGLTAPPAVARHIGIDRIWFSTTFNAWAPDILRLSDGTSPIPSISPIQGVQGGGGPVIEPPPGGSGGGSCILTKMPVLVLEKRKLKFKPFDATGVGDRLMGDIKLAYQVLRKRHAMSSEYLVLLTKNGIRYECNRRHRLLVDIKRRIYRAADNLVVGDEVPAWVCGRIRTTTIIGKNLIPKAVDVGIYVLRDMSGIHPDGQGVFVAGYSDKEDRGLLCSNAKPIDDRYLLP